MESIKELREICIKRHKRGITKPHWWATLFARRVSIYVTWFIIKYTKISANQVTICQLITSLAGLASLCFANVWIAFTGTILLHLGYIFDNVDGEVARYRKAMSINGMFLDFVNHEIIIPMIFGCLAFHYYFLSGLEIYFALGLITVFCKINPIGKARQITIDYLIQKRNSPSYNISNYEPTTDSQKCSLNISTSAFNGDVFSKIKYLRKETKKIFEYPNDVVIVSIIIFIELATGNVMVGKLFSSVYAIYLVFSFITDLYVHLLNNVVERDFNGYIKAALEIDEKINSY